MAVSVEAIYVNGVLIPVTPLPWKDGERLRLSVSSFDSPILKAGGIIQRKRTDRELDDLLDEIADDEIAPEKDEA
jgi:predicted DNA-binding antitoxin AbrB/MazE fold protein